MRSLLPFLLLTLSLRSFAQDGSAHATLNAHLKELTAALTDTARDQASLAITKGLRALLEADDALTASFADVPMSHIDAPDGKFRLFTWNVPHDDGTHRYEGMLLVQSDNRRVLYELRDMTEKLPTPISKKLGPDNWYGALYYAVIPQQVGHTTYYTLLGWKGYSKVETRKVIEVLTFSGPVPTFGAPIFNDGDKTRPLRKVYGFNFQSTMSLKWDPPNKAIVMDHLAPMKPEFAGKPELSGPDLSFDAYVWYKGRWSYLRDVDARNMNIAPPPPRKLK